MVRSDRNEVCLYEAMFLAGLKLPFPRLVWEFLNYLNLAPHQIIPNIWRVFFASVALWPKVLGEGEQLTVREFM